MKYLSVGAKEHSSLCCSELRASYEALCDLHAHPAARAELDLALRATGLDIAFWIYESRHSSGVANEGASGTEPLVQIWLRTSAELAGEAGIDPRRGNWDDTWVRTAAIRDAANAILERYGLGEEFCSPDSFVFAHSWEQYCWHTIAAESEGAVRELVSRLVLGRWHRFLWNNRNYPSVYCGSAWERPAPGAFNIVFAREDEMLRAKAMIEDIRKGCSEILRQGRHDGCIENFDVCIQLWWRGMNLPPLYRRD